MVLKSPAAFEVNNHTVLARKLSIPLLYSVCMYLHSLTQPCDVNPPTVEGPPRGRRGAARGRRKYFSLGARSFGGVCNVRKVN